MTFVPPARFWRILISRLIFFFLTGLSTLMTHLSSLTTLTPSNTSEYCVRVAEVHRPSVRRAPHRRVHGEGREAHLAPAHLAHNLVVVLDALQEGGALERSDTARLEASDARG